MIAFNDKNLTGFHSTTRTSLQVVIIDFGSRSVCMDYMVFCSTSTLVPRTFSQIFWGLHPYLSLLSFEMLKLCAKAAFALKQSSLKCLLHSTKCSVGSNCAWIHLTCFTHFTWRTGSFGNLKRLIELVGVLEQPGATQCQTIFHNRKWSNGKTHSSHAALELPFPWWHNSKLHLQAETRWQLFKNSNTWANFCHPPLVRMTIYTQN